MHHAKRLKAGLASISSDMRDVLMEYLYAAQLRPVYCWCKREFGAKWKDVEKDVHQILIQTMVGDHPLY